MVVFDYLRWSEQDAALVEIQSAFQRSLPGLSVAMRGCWGPFEDSEGLASHFDGGANRLAGTKRVKRLRVDLLTSCAKVLREATGFKPQFLVGLGQGGLVAAVLRWPLVVELTLQARNLQRKEARATGEAWAGIKAIWVLRPRLWRTQSGHQDITESCLELQREFPGIEEASVRGMLAEPSREMWDHDGLCACGKRTYLFSRCPACIEQEALDTAVEIAEREDLEVRGSTDRDPESPEVGVEVNGVLAARERAGGALEVPSSAVQSWAAGFLQVIKLWKGGAHLTLSRGTSTDQLKYITAWVVREGAVVLGHNSSPVDTVKSGVVLSWSVEPNWHGHRHLVNAMCESLWRASGQELALDPAFDRLLCLVGKPRRVEGWFDSEGEACIAHRRGLRKQGVLATFTCRGEGHWTTSPLSAKIVVDESQKTRTLCFVGDLH
ncbi:pol, partial [Symbiodinium sp. KB8]